MRRMLKKSLLIAAACLMLSGCGAEAVELSDEDTKRVANFSSDVISQHNQYSNSRLADVEEVKWEYQKQVDLEVKKKNFIAQQRAAGMLDETQEGESGTEGEGSAGLPEEEEVPVIPLEQALGVEEAKITYANYEVLDSYPSAQENADVFMGMTAAPGDKLLVLHFTLSNPGTSDIFCDVLKGRPQFRVRINGERKTIQQTILPNDLSKFSDVIEGGGQVDTVLISEVLSSDASNISSLSLIVRSAEGRPEYPLIEGRPLGEGGDVSEGGGIPEAPIPEMDTAAPSQPETYFDENAEEPYGILTYQMPQQ